VASRAPKVSGVLMLNVVLTRFWRHGSPALKSWIGGSGCGSAAKVSMGVEFDCIIVRFAVSQCPTEPLHWRAKRDPKAKMLFLQSFLLKGVSLGYVGEKLQPNGPQG
jgi:hypothetical protein